MKIIITLLVIFISVQNSFSQNTWSAKSSLSSNARMGAAGFSIGQKGYIGFGAGVNYSGPYYNDLWEWDQPTNSWTQKANCPGAGRMTPIAFAIGTKGYFAIGSLGQGNGLIDVWEWDQPSNTWTSKAAFPGGARGFAAGFCIGTNGYICAGSLYPGGITDDLWEYNSLTDTWQQKASITGGARIHSGGLSIGNKGYVGGGNGNIGFLNDFWEYDPANNSWVQKADLPTVRREFITFSICDYGYWGTGSMTSLTSENDLWRYDPVNDSWLQMANYGGGNKERALAFSIGLKGYVGTGYCGDTQCGSTTDDFWEYTPDSTTCFPTVSFVAPNEICPGTCTDFNNTSVGATSFQWYFPGGTPGTSTDANPSNICYANTGSYDVQLIAINSNGSDTLLLSNYITVYPAPPPQGILQSGDTLFANQGAALYQWYYNGNPINGATNYFYAATTSGDYNVVATDTNGCEVEAVINDVIAGLNQFPVSSSQFVIFPNPVTDKFTIYKSQVTSGAAVEISVYNILGEKIYTEFTPLSLGEGFGGEVDCRHLTEGIYYLEIISKNIIYRAKFMKQ